MNHADKRFHLKLHRGDLADGVELADEIAIDTETMGLRVERDRLCLVQLTDNSGVVHLVKFDSPNFDCPNLKALLADETRLKIFHFARFDMSVLQRSLGVTVAPVYCTKIASKIARTYTDRHGLKDLLREIVGAEISKTEQSSDWGRSELSEAQQEYAARDVVHLHDLRKGLEEMLVRERRASLAHRCFAFLPDRVALDLAGWDNVDIFAHS